MKGDAWLWLWLFPVTCAAHVFEESAGIDSMYDWLQRNPESGLSGSEFWVLTSLAVLGMTALVAAIQRWPGIRWLAAALGVAVIANGVSHSMTSLASGAYNPGLATAILLWWPLGGYAVARCWRTLPRHLFWRGALLGVAMQAGVSATTILFVLAH